MSRPSTVPISAITNAWMSCCLTSRRLLAPSAARNANSPSRSMTWASRRPAKFAAAINSVQTAAPTTTRIFGPQIHDKTFAQRRDVSGTHVRRIRIVAIDRGAHALHSFFRFRRRDTGTQSRDAIEIMVVNRRRIVRLKRKRQPQTRAIRMPECFRHHADNRPWCSIDHDRAAEHVAT